VSKNDDKKSSEFSKHARVLGEREMRAEHSPLARKVLLPAHQYIHDEAVGAGALVVMALVALVWANSPWSESYFALWHTPVRVGIGQFMLEKDLSHWVNDGLMVLFFLTVTLEIKREFVHGVLSQFRTGAIPVLAAVGGMVAPVIIFLSITAGTPAAGGWAIPMATDIAFAVGAIALLGDRVPRPLKIILLTYAVVDDIGSILVIALYFTSNLSWLAALIALALLSVMFTALKTGLRSVGIYLLLGIGFWLAMLHTGVHATIAGILIALITPPGHKISPRIFAAKVRQRAQQIPEAARRGDDETVELTLGQQTEAPLDRIQRLVHPWVTFLILPLFALANAGVRISGEVAVEAIYNPLTLGIFFGLVFGKVIGTFSLPWLGARLGLLSLPRDVNWLHLIGIGMLGGVGFTVALFIANLSFDEELQIIHARLGILSASIVAAIAGYFFLRCIGGGPKSAKGRG
jgi:NhaA family Na+:H+ antiporter